MSHQAREIWAERRDGRRLTSVPEIVIFLDGPDDRPTHIPRLPDRRHAPRVIPHQLGQRLDDADLERRMLLTRLLRARVRRRGLRGRLERVRWGWVDGTGLRERFGGKGRFRGIGSGEDRR